MILPAVPVPWLIGGAAVGLLASGLVGYRIGSGLEAGRAAKLEVARAEAYAALIAERDREATTAAIRDAEASRLLAGELVRVRGEYAALQQTVAELSRRRLLTEEREGATDEDGRCVVRARSELYRLCYNAAFSGLPGPGSACEAPRGDATAARAVPTAAILQPRD